MDAAELVQGGPEWLAARCGKVTASKLSDLTAKTKTGWGASRANYLALLVAERLTGKPAESYTNAAMQWGTDHEAEARKAYEDKTGFFVEQVGFVAHPTIEMCGASPDGLCGADGLVEIKCPNTATHIETLLGAEIERKYLLQMAWQMACTGRKWCDMASFDPRLPERMRLSIKRVQRDDALIASLTVDVTDFLREVDETVAKLTSKYGGEQAPITAKERAAEAAGRTVGQGGKDAQTASGAAVDPHKDWKDAADGN